MNDTLERWFALIIGQLLPGLFVVFGASFHVPVLRAWLGTASTDSITAGSVLLVILTAIASGLLLSGARAFLFEVLGHVAGVGRRDEQPVNVSARRNREVETAYQAIVAQHYAYFQFYGSSAIAVPLVALLALTSPWATHARIIVGISGSLLMDAVLIWSARDAMRRFLEKRLQLLGAVAASA